MLVQVTSSTVPQLYSFCQGLASETCVSVVRFGPTHRLGNSTNVPFVTRYVSASFAFDGVP